MEAIIIIALIVINIFTVYKLLFNLIFSSSDDFNESVRYFFTPDIISLFRGEYWKDRLSQFKLGIFLFLCVIAIVIEYWMINGIIQWITSL